MGLYSVAIFHFYQQYPEEMIKLGLYFLLLFNLNDHNFVPAGLRHDVHYNADFEPDLRNVSVGYVILLIEFIATL